MLRLGVGALAMGALEDDEDSPEMSSVSSAWGQKSSNGLGKMSKYLLHILRSRDMVPSTLFPQRHKLSAPALPLFYSLHFTDSPSVLYVLEETDDLL